MSALISRCIPKSKESVKIFSEIPVYKSVEGHFSKAPFLIAAEMFGDDLDFEMVGQEICAMAGKSVAEPHVHTHPEIYLLVSSKPGDAEILVETAQGSYTMTSPSSAFIPAHVQHRFIVQKSSPGSFCFGILLKNNHAAKTAPPQSVGEIFSSAIASNAILVLEATGILKILDEETKILEDDERIQKLNALVIQSSLRSLARSKILNRTIDEHGVCYVFTSLGKEVYQNVGSFVLWLTGYRNFIAHQTQIASSCRSIMNECSTDGAAVARSSAMLGRKYIDSEVIDFIKQVQPQGKVCDLGCGDGSRLMQICKMTKTSGLGIDFSEGAIQEANKLILSNNVNVQFKTADVTALTESMPEVDVFMQAFLTHHFLPDELCVNVFKRYRQVFSKARYFLLLDTVDRNEPFLKEDVFYPGFEYIHSLRGVKPRTIDEMIKIINAAGYIIEKEINLQLSNYYFWGLKVIH